MRQWPDMEKIICLRFTVIFQGREDVRMELEKKRGDTYRKELEENEELKRQLTAKNRCDHNEQSPNKDGKFIVFKRFQRTSIKSFWFYQHNSLMSNQYQISVSMGFDLVLP